MSDAHSSPKEKHAQLPVEEKEKDVEALQEIQPVVLPAGVLKVEAAQAVWSKKAKWFLWFGLALACYAYSLDGSTTWQYLYYATSEVLNNSLSATVSTAGAIIIAVGKPLMAKSADTFGRAETYVVVLFSYVLGYILNASANSIGQIAAGTIFYSLGYTGLQILTQVVLADTTTLRWRGFAGGLVSLPFVINGFVAAEIAQGILPNWRWGYGMFAVIIPVCLAPVIGSLFWGQHKAKKIAVLEPKGPRRSFAVASRDYFNSMDAIGLVLIAASLALILLPLGLAKTASNGWRTPSMIVMIVLGIVLFPVFVIWEWKFAKVPLAPPRFFKSKTIVAACAIGFLDFVSFYLQYTYQYNFVSVVKYNWTYRSLTYFSLTQSMGLTIFAILGGAIMYATRRYKWLMFVGLLIRLLGVGLMIHSRGAKGSDAEIVMCQVLQSIGGGFAAITLQVSAQAGVVHADVATVTALVLLITEIGNSVGSAIAAAVWTNQMPKQLAIHVGNNATLNAELYASITTIMAYPIEDPIRVGAISAYEVVMKNLCIGATIVAIFPPIICFIWTRDLPLVDAQNALDGKTGAGEQTGDGLVETPEHLPTAAHDSRVQQ
ncbi:major facilitator superfamily domain-containing protein [Mrakia frigida]|uniref:major facilitator superfamily domain-containing protein n=1 Tax=Mrakia frigida TaxID=29902 RepID=UPI003FCC1391